MGTYTAKRLLRGLVTIWLVTLVVFMLLRITGDPVDFLINPQMGAEDRAQMKKDFGLDAPWYVQYGKFNKEIFQGNFGVSIQRTGDTAFEMFKERVPATLQLVGAALIFAMVMAIILGVISATRPNSLTDQFIRVLAITGQSMPAFWLGLLFILLFSVYLGWLPSAGGLDRVGLKGLIMPAVSLGWFLVAAGTRLIRSSMLQVLDSDYITMLRAKGMPRRIIILKHALRNASLPVITLFALSFANLIGGALITEAIFSWPGVGRLMVTAISTRDYAVVQTVVFFSAVAIVLTNILVDLLYGWLDPRVRLS